MRTIESSASFLILMGMIQPFLHLGCLSYVAFINLKFVPSSPSLSRTFIMKVCWSLSKNFSVSTQMSMWFVSLHLVTLLVYWLTYVEPSLHLWNIANFGDLFSHMPPQFKGILLNIFVTMFIKDIGLWFWFICPVLTLLWYRVISFFFLFLSFWII